MFLDDELDAPTFWLEPRRSEILLAWMAYTALQPLWWLVPITWSDMEITGWRSAAFYWVASECFWQYERAKGRV